MPTVQGSRSSSNRLTCLKWRQQLRNRAVPLVWAAGCSGRRVDRPSRSV